MAGQAAIRVKRVYEAPAAADGARYLVDRLWPRGMKKEALNLVGWARDAAPSNALRREFGHDPGRWEEFRAAYHAELDANPEAWRPLLAAARQEGGITLLFAARDTARNNAVALKEYLEARLAEGAG